MIMMVDINCGSGNYTSWKSIHINNDNDDIDYGAKNGNDGDHR